MLISCENCGKNFEEPGVIGPATFNLYFYENHRSGGSWTCSGKCQKELWDKNRNSQTPGSREKGEV